MIALGLALLSLMVVFVLIGYVAVELIDRARQARDRLSRRVPSPDPPPPLAPEAPRWTTLDDQQLARFLKEATE